MLWTTVAYLLVYYALLLWAGPDRLYEALGTEAYNALLPSGGFLLLLGLLANVVIWGLPAAALAGPGWLLTWLAPARWVGRRRVLLSAIGGVALTAVLHLASLDGWPQTLFPLLGLDDTEFAPGYTAPGFWSVRQGMTREDVASRIGQPITRYRDPRSPAEESWVFSRSPHSADYRVRSVRFRDGRVVERHSEYYFD